MSGTPKKSILDGLARILHLHQLPRAENDSKPASSSPERVRPEETHEDASLSSHPRPPILPVEHSVPSSTRAMPISPTMASVSKAAPVAPGAVSKKYNPWPTFFPPGKKPVGAVRAAPAATPPAAPFKPMTISAQGGDIVTDYDLILDLVKRNQSIKLDEIARVLQMTEERIAEELQTLEDNALIEIKYPAFGEPLIVYRKPA